MRFGTVQIGTGVTDVVVVVVVVVVVLVVDVDVVLVVVVVVVVVVLKLGRPGPSGVPSMVPARTGNDAEALTLITLPRMLLTIGVMSENRQVIATTAGEPSDVPPGYVGFGMEPGIVQLMSWVSALTSRTYSACTTTSTGDWNPCGLSAAKLAASRTAL